MYCNSPLITINLAFFLFLNPKQRSSNIDTMEKVIVHKLNPSKTETQDIPSWPQTDGLNKICERTLHQETGRWWHRGPQRPLRLAKRESWEEQGLDVLHWYLQTLNSQSKYCETLHNATRDSYKQAWLQRGAYRWYKRMYTSATLGFIRVKDVGNSGQAGNQRETIPLNLDIKGSQWQDRHRAQGSFLSLSLLLLRLSSFSDSQEYTPLL